MTVRRKNEYTVLEEKLVKKWSLGRGRGRWEMLETDVCV